MSLKFISYDGQYPNLCSGNLKVEINGKIVTFGGYESSKKNLKYPMFWMSGGRVSFDKDWNENVTKGEWMLEANQKNYPKYIWKLMPQLINLMNSNVWHGCCGGCV